MINYNLIHQNKTDEEINTISNKIEAWVEKNKKNPWVIICANIWLRKLMEKF